MNKNLAQENLIARLGLSALPQKEQDEVAEKFSGVLFQAVMLKSLQSLDEEQKDRLEKVMSKNPEDLDAMMKFFEQEVPNFSELVGNEIDEIMRAAGSVMGQ